MPKPYSENDISGTYFEQSAIRTLQSDITQAGVGSSTKAHTRGRQVFARYCLDSAAYNETV